MNIKKLMPCVFCLVAVGCSKPDPILPGHRSPIFEGNEVVVLNKEIPKEKLAAPAPVVEHEFTQDKNNTIWKGDKKIFTGFPASTSVGGPRLPVVQGSFIYAGLSTGELVKVNKNNRSIAWIADIYRDSNMTGGASILDIVASPVVSGNYVYAGGLGDAFCKLNVGTGTKVWCAEISTGMDFIIAGSVAFVVSVDNYLYAIDTGTGKAYWKKEVKEQQVPRFAGEYIYVGKEKIKTGV